MVSPKSQIEKQIDEIRKSGNGGGVGETIPDHNERFNSYTDAYGQGHSFTTSDYCHSEGQHNLFFSASCSHAEGKDNSVSGSYAHAGGTGCYADGNASFAHGSQCKAKSGNSVALNFGTNAYGQNQTVIGKYNEDDDDSEYAFIIGGGTGDRSTQRKNIFTVDWEGNVNVEGKLSVKGGFVVSFKSESHGSYEETKVYSSAGRWNRPTFAYTPTEGGYTRVVGFDGMTGITVWGMVTLQANTDTATIPFSACLGNSDAVFYVPLNCEKFPDTDNYLEIHCGYDPSAASYKQMLITANVPVLAELGTFGKVTLFVHGTTANVIETAEEESE